MPAAPFPTNKSMFTYQASQRYFAQIASGTEEMGVNELEQLGASNVNAVFRGIHFSADKGTLYKINYMARTITRVLAPLISFRSPDTDVLYRKTRQIPWPDFFDLKNTFAVFANVSHSRISHSQHAALCVKDAIADRFREKFNRRPNVERVTPDVWINLHIHGDNATINLDTSGGSMHRRGYRKASLEAPMQETVAAAIIRMTEWNGEKPLYDPMCGTGTILSEALMHHCRIPSGFLRKRFGFKFLPDYNKKTWDFIKRKADKQIRDLPQGMISGSDISPHAISSAEMNLSTLPYGKSVRLTHTSFQDIPAMENAVIVCNPPYGIRMGRPEEQMRLIREFGDFLKQRCAGSAAYLYFGDRELIKKIGLKPSWKKPLKSGGLDGRLVKYEMY